VPVAEPVTSASGGLSGVTDCAPAKLPLNGTSCLAAVAGATPATPGADEGPVGDADSPQPTQSRAAASVETASEPFMLTS
jgi:hypothetical protein